MSLRGLAVLLLVLGLLAVALVRLRGPKEEETPAAPDTPVLAAFDEAKVRAVRTTCGETSYELRSGPTSGWRLTAPYAAEADPRQVRTLISALHDARVRKVISAGASDDAGFGLGHDACTVRLEIEGDAAGRTLAIGRSSPVGYERYALDTSRHVVFVDGSLFTAIAKAPDALEERRLIPLDPESVTRLTIERPDGRIVLARAGDAWRLEEPVRDAADAFEADRTVRAATSLERERGTKAPPPASSVPERRIAISAEGMTAYVAAAGIEGKRLAWREGSSEAGLVKESDLEDIVRPASALLDRQVLSFSSPDARRIVVTRGSTVLTLARASEQAAWSVSEGSGPPADADASRVAALLDRLRGVRAAAVEEAAPPSAPTGTIVVSGEKAELARATWGPLPPAAGEESVWVTTPGRPGAVFRVPAASFGPIPQKRGDLLPSASPSPSAAP